MRLSNGQSRQLRALETSIDPDPEDPALNSSQRGDERGNFYQQVSGVPPEADQQLKSTRRVRVAHELDFLPLLLTFSLNPSRVQDSGWFLLTSETPETTNNLDRWHSRLCLI